jgi:glycosyltransferase involved in cell wall biosynthesis
MNFKIGVLQEGNPMNDRRVLTELKALSEMGHVVEVLCFKEELPNDNQEKFVTRPIIDLQIMNIKNFSYPLQIAQTILTFEYDVVHCHNWHMLKIGAYLKKLNPKIILIYESRELFHSWPLNNKATDSLAIKVKSKIVRKLEIRREKKDAFYADYILTVNESIAKIVSHYFNKEGRTFFTRNIPQLPVFQTPGENVLRQLYCIEADKKILVFIGAHIYPRTLNIEQVISEIANQKDWVLVCICREDSAQKEVAAYASKIGANNIYFHPLLPQRLIISYLQMADVGLVPTWNKKDLSYWLALDNKLFEYLMAELPILATQQPEYQAIVAKYEVGVCVNPDEPGAYLQGLKKIIAAYPSYKTNLIAAKKILNWDNEKQKLIDLYSLIEKNIHH